MLLCVGDNVSSPLSDEKVQGRMPLNESGTAEDLGFRLFWEAKAFPYLYHPKGVLIIMEKTYNPSVIEKKWQAYWEENQTFKTDVWDFSKPKYYALDMFPYPSGVGLHAGHPEGYTATDIMSRMKRMQGYNVLHPMGYDSFGLPAEQYAVSTGNHPNGFTEQNIETFSKQLKELGFDYDWTKMLATSDPKFYKWTQWIFKQLYLDGYAKYIDMPVNWCEELGTVLSNDEVIDGKSERGGYPVVRKNMKQWVIDQVAFADKLLEGLNEIDWPESTKEMQRHWIGRSEGVEVDFQIVGGGSFSIYTTCIETIYGITFMVLAPDGQIVKDLMPRIENKEEVEAYIAETLKKNDMDRTELNKTKSGCRLQGISAINPVNGKEVPLFIGDFVLANYGTGAVMAVPSHDQRDFEYAIVHNIPMIQVIDGGDVSEKAFEKYDYLGKGCKLMNSEEFTGLTVEEAKVAITDKLISMGVARKKLNFKMRDWIFSRQRYWGEPIPMVKCEKCGWVPVADKDLPITLPNVDSYEPTKDGESPLSTIPEWVNTTCPCCGAPAKRETDTMPGWAGSSWYFIRYCDPHNDKEMCSQDAMKAWLPVNLYNGGNEHTTRHLLYARFWVKFLYDIGVSPIDEPFSRRISQGLILGSDGKKMSKSAGNGVDPREVIAEYGTDALRLWMSFIGDYFDKAAWSDEGVKACNKFLNRVWNLQDILVDGDDYSKELSYEINYAIKKVTEDMDNVKFNTAIAALMILANEVQKVGKINKAEYKTLLTLLNPFAPHITEEVWTVQNFEPHIKDAVWPVWDEAKLVKDEVEYAVQINNKIIFRDNSLHKAFTFI